MKRQMIATIKPSEVAEFNKNGWYIKQMLHTSLDVKGMYHCLLEKEDEETAKIKEGESEDISSMKTYNPKEKW